METFTSTHTNLAIKTLEPPATTFIRPFLSTSARMPPFFHSVAFSPSLTQDLLQKTNPLDYQVPYQYCYIHPSNEDQRLAGLTR